MKMLEIIELEINEEQFESPEVDREKIAQIFARVEGNVILQNVNRGATVEMGDRFADIKQSVITTRGSEASDIRIVGMPSAAALDDVLRPLTEAIGAAPAEIRSEAEAKLGALKQEAAKGKAANDGVIAKIVDGIVELIPGAASAVVSAFATPILGGIAGPVTGFVLDKLRPK